MTGLFDLTYEQLVKLRDEASVFWGELHQDTQEYLNQIIERRSLAGSAGITQGGTYKNGFRQFL